MIGFFPIMKSSECLYFSAFYSKAVFDKETSDLETKLHNT